jgi:hypothetical protein
VVDEVEDVGGAAGARSSVPVPSHNRLSIVCIVVMCIDNSISVKCIDSITVICIDNSMIVICIESSIIICIDNSIIVLMCIDGIIIMCLMADHPTNWSQQCM